MCQHSSNTSRTTYKQWLATTVVALTQSLITARLQGQPSIKSMYPRPSANLFTQASGSRRPSRTPSAAFRIYHHLPPHNFSCTESGHPPSTGTLNPGVSACNFWRSCQNDIALDCCTRPHSGNHNISCPRSTAASLHRQPRSKFPGMQCAPFPISKVDCVAARRSRWPPVACSLVELAQSTCKR